MHTPLLPTTGMSLVPPVSVPTARTHPPLVNHHDNDAHSAPSHTSWAPSMRPGPHLHIPAPSTCPVPIYASSHHPCVPTPMLMVCAAARRPSKFYPLTLTGHPPSTCRPPCTSLYVTASPQIRKKYVAAAGQGRCQGLCPSSSGRPHLHPAVPIFVRPSPSSSGRPHLRPAVPIFVRPSPSSSDQTTHIVRSGRPDPPDLTGPCLILFMNSRMFSFHNTMSL